MSKDDLRKELDQLNQAVTDAVKCRTDWMDAHMPDFAKVQVGEELFDSAYRRVGTVTKLYRFWGDGRDWRFDTSMDVNYVYSYGFGTNNTSSQMGFFPHSKADVERHKRQQYESLRREFGVTA